MKTDHIRFIETLAMHAWPAKVIEPLDGWLLRQHDDPSRRVNSVWPNKWDGEIPLAAKLEQVEAFYTRFGQPARYQVCPANLPAGLDDVLAARGYRIDAPTLVQTTSVENARNLSGDSEIRVILSETLTPGWLQAYGKAENYSAGKLSERETALRGIQQRSVYAVIHQDGQGVAVGRGVLDSGWLGIFGMATLPQYRRKGLATAILQALATWAKENQAINLYLQVMTNNPGAIYLYEKLGFETLYGYHYRTEAVRLSGIIH